MLKRMSTYFLRTLREDPSDAEIASHKLLVRAGYIRRAAPGIYTWMPLGLRVLNKVADIVRAEMDAIGCDEVEFPALLPKEPYETTNRWEDFGPSLFKLQDRRANDYLLAPTHEEMFTLLVKGLYSSYKDLPTMLYQIQTKYRDEARPRAGIMRGREFVMKDAYSFDIDDEGLARSYALQRSAYQRIFDTLGLPYVICSAMSGAMGGSQSEEFLLPSPAGEDTFVVSDGGYAANVEAVTTPAPEPLDYSDVPAAEVLPTPDSTTIETLVEQSNTLHPRSDRPWEASDTLKNVVVRADYPDGKSEVLVIGIPGDREVDMARLEASLAPAEVEMATSDDLAAYPQLVPGYIGPQVLGSNTNAEAPRYLVDPRVVVGSRWITGANRIDYHVFNLVMGRDFQVDGTVEAAEVHDGDPAPDGSGPLRTMRGVELGHVFALGRKYAEALDLEVLDDNGKSRVVTMGSYGIGVSRALAALVEINHDDSGIKWPINVAPFQVHLMATGKQREVFDTANELAETLDAAGVEVLYDDRLRLSAGVKFKDAELLGMPVIVVVGKGLSEGLVEIRSRVDGLSRQVPVADAPDAIQKLIGELTAAIGREA